MGAPAHEATGTAALRDPAKSKLALANAKEVLHAVWADNASVESGLRIERERDAFYCLTADDAREGLAAFAEKRTPRFTGR